MAAVITKMGAAGVACASGVTPPPGRPGPPGPLAVSPLPPPLANADLKTPCSSAAWSLVNLPLDTSLAIRVSIFDFRSPGEELVLLAESLAEPPCSDELMSFSAEESADWSDELTAPEVTSDCSSASSFCRGLW
jgi:hypothetical protein